MKEAWDLLGRWRSPLIRCLWGTLSQPLSLYCLRFVQHEHTKDHIAPKCKELGSMIALTLK